MTSIGRPYQYMQSFRVYWQDTEVMDDGMVVKGDEKEAPDAIIDGILAEADMKTMEIWKQNQTPISHTIVSYHPVVKLSKNDVLLLGDDPCHDRKFIVKGTKDPAGTGQFSIYYVLERSDTDQTLIEGDQVTSRIKSNSKHAEWLEGGTKKMAKRPFIDPIKKKAEPEIVKIFGSDFEVTL